VARTSIFAHDDGASTVVVLTGDVDLALAAQARRALAVAVAAGKPVVVDLRDVTFLDSWGVHFLVQCRRACLRVGLPCSLREAPAPVRYVLDLLGLRALLGVPDGPPATTSWVSAGARAEMPAPSASTEAVCRLLSRGIEPLLGTPVGVCATADLAGARRLLGDVVVDPGVPGEHRAAWLPVADATEPTAAAVWAGPDDARVCVSVRSAAAADWALVRDQIEAVAALLATMVQDERASDGLAADVADLSAALESRAVIDQAQGVIMAQNRCGSEQAVQILRAASSHRNQKLAEVAAGIVEQVAGSRPAPAPFRPRTSV
jgi:anti-anti-sigma factor